MSEGNLVVGARIECKQGTEPVKELKVPEDRPEKAAGKKRIYMKDVVPGKNFDVFGKCKLLIVNGVMQPCAPDIVGSKWFATNNNDDNEKKEAASTLGSFMVCAKGCLIEPISTGQGGAAPTSSDKMSLEDLALKQMLAAKYLTVPEIQEISAIYQKTKDVNFKDKIFDKLFPEFNEETAAYNILEQQMIFLNAKVQIEAAKYLSKLQAAGKAGTLTVDDIISQLGWNHDKVNLLWDKVKVASREYNVLLDPRILLSLVFVEGTGSFDTNRDVLYGGGAGVDPDFDRDAYNAILQMARKVVGYSIYSKEFIELAIGAGLDQKGSFLEYMTHDTPQPGNKTSGGHGVYAENSQKWAIDVNEKLSFLYDFSKYPDNKTYREYIKETEFPDHHDIQSGISQGITNDLLSDIFDDDKNFELSYNGEKFVCTEIK